MGQDRRGGSGPTASVQISELTVDSLLMDLFGGPRVCRYAALLAERRFENHVEERMNSCRRVLGRLSSAQESVAKILSLVERELEGSTRR